jgi:hypothetical protein
MKIWNRDIFLVKGTVFIPRQTQKVDKQESDLAMCATIGADQFHHIGPHRVRYKKLKTNFVTRLLSSGFTVGSNKHTYLQIIWPTVSELPNYVNWKACSLFGIKPSLHYLLQCLMIISSTSWMAIRRLFLIHWPICPLNLNTLHSTADPSSATLVRPPPNLTVSCLICVAAAIPNCHKGKR